MNEKKNFAQKAGHFLAGRGFYIVLFICTAVIGISTWVLLFPSENLTRKASDTYIDYSTETESDVFAPVVPPPVPAVTPIPKPTAPALTVTPAPASPPPTVDKPIENKPTVETEPEGDSITVSGPATIDELRFARPVAGDISMEFAIDALVFSRTMGDWRTHRGVDLAGALGAKVLAVCDGTVTDIKKDDLFGTMVIIDHGFNLRSVYANLAEQPAVAVGDSVSLGSVIGSIGSTALAETGEVTHLHFEMTLAGSNIDPFMYIPG